MLLDDERLPSREGLDTSQSVLVVSEDPGFVHHLQGRFQVGTVVRGCLGPADNFCELDRYGSCMLVEHSTIVLVDSPQSGVFGRRWSAVPAGTYAERIASVHPESFVILCGAPVGTAGPSGEVAHVATRAAAEKLIGWILHPIPERSAPAEKMEREVEGS
jgi:hypothetical protein